MWTLLTVCRSAAGPPPAAIPSRCSDVSAETSLGFRGEEGIAAGGGGDLRCGLAAASSVVSSVGQWEKPHQTDSSAQTRVMRLGLRPIRRGWNCGGLRPSSLVSAMTIVLRIRPWALRLAFLRNDIEFVR